MTLLPYIYDFLSLAMQSPEHGYISKIILFGSVATGAYDDESDIDLFIEMKDNSKKKQVDDMIEKTKKQFETINEKTWKLQGVENSFSCIVGKLEEWEGLKEDILNVGIQLYGSFEQTPDDLDHYVLFSYKLKKVKQNKKMKLLRTLFGYTNVIGKKKYTQKGLVESVDGAKIGKNAILVPVKAIKEVRQIFISMKVTPQIRDVWVRK
ncbi:hypothetical protein CL622_02950 [archaeon]|nr:hypothetical protein [archaeon]|tara:strand:+ start:1110 stop:1733 length:624 start_codon:yes stop_codon:yes gene_type:complete